MRAEKNPVVYYCTEDELTAEGLPPTLDENGTAVSDSAMCELLNDDGSITKVFMFADGAWYQYGEAPEALPEGE